MSERIICNENGGELREEIIRCRDCKWFDKKGLCRRDMSCDELAVSAGPDAFCAWGERKEGV